ncbi:MAG: DUF4007 family protein [Synechococcales cyanobacterium C42_A2020_086]|jgi:hypothetical protein|nr:DUF4007 family protein [Synechococcales cyanobacterium C42_A2020_086]
MPELQLGFHTTFALKKEDLQKVLRAADEPQGLQGKLDDLMQRTGLGNKKVGPVRSWAVRCGLVQGHRLSPEGRVVMAHDPELRSPVTDWLMHFYLSFGDKGLSPVPQSPAEWGGWTWLVYQFLPAHFTFSVENLVYEAGLVFERETSKNLEKNLRYALRAYTEPQALAACQFVQELSNTQYATGEARLPHPYLVGYFLAKLWERDYGDVTSVITEDVCHHPMGLAPLLGLEPTSLQDQLDKLEVYGLVEQRRTVPPHQLVRRWDRAIALLEQAYAQSNPTR